jgi:hypothetical protein
MPSAAVLLLTAGVAHPGVLQVFQHVLERLVVALITAAEVWHAGGQVHGQPCALRRPQHGRNRVAVLVCCGGTQRGKQVMAGPARQAVVC